MVPINLAVEQPVCSVGSNMIQYCTALTVTSFYNTTVLDISYHFSRPLFVKESLKKKPAVISHGEQSGGIADDCCYYY